MVHLLQIIMQGRHVFMGYLHEEEKTRETLDANDDLCSGDIGKQDSDGYWYITGRIKGTYSYVYKFVLSLIFVYVYVYLCKADVTLI